MIGSIHASLMRRLALVALLYGALQPALAQDVTHSVPTLEAMERQLALYQDAKPEDAQKTRLKDLYVAAVQSLRDAAENREDRARFDRLQAEAPAKLARYGEQLQALQRGARSASKASRNVGVGRLGRLLGEQREALDALRSEEAALARRLATLQSRIEPARAELKQLATVEEGDVTPQPLAGESPQLSRARLDEWRARHEYHASLRERLESEVRTLPQRIGAVQAELKLVSARREQAERFVAELQGLERLKRIEDATRQREEMRARIATVPATVPEAVRLAGEVSTLADEQVDLISHIEGLIDEVDVAGEAVETLRSAHDGMRQQLAIAALNDALGPVLLEHYRQLSAFEQPDAKLRALAVQLSEMRLREFQVDQLLDTEPALRERSYAAVQADGDGDTAQREALAMIDSLLADRVTLLEALAREYGEATRHVVELDELYQEQAQVAAQFRTLVDRHLVWMKSHPPLGPGVLLHWPALTLGLLAAQDWSGFTAETLTSILQHPLSALAAVLVLLLVLRYDTRLRARLADLGLRKVGWHQYRFVMALQALGILLLLALPVPLLLWWAGWLMGGMAADNPLARALGLATRSVGILSYGYLFVLEVLGPEGFARQHLRWKTAPVQRCERVLRRALWVLLPLAFLASALRGFPSPTADDAVARVAGMLLALALLATTLLALRGGRGMFNTAFYGRSYPLLGTAAVALVVALVAAQPLSVALDATGYSFTGTALLVRVFFSIVVLLVAKLVLDTGLIGLAIAGKRSLAALSEQPAKAGEAVAEDTAVGTVVGETGEAIDLEKMSASAIALLHVAVIGGAAVVLVVLWSQFFAALSILDEVGLWSYAATVDGKDTTATVSVLDLLGALLVLVLGFVLAKGLPALLGIVLIGFVTRKGLLFAIQTVISYVVGTVGVIAALQMLGFGWSKLQWMAAGLSVGLGFGLQEIFANFFAGLIMLFERPVRIGDVVTLGEYSGTIKNIRMRSTMLTDFDNREIIVPNKMFVTERLINWTLTNGVVRLSFDVGVSYAADPRLVRDTLLQILAEDLRVLQDPPPSVIFREFGASSLNFRCFAHVEDISVRFLVQNDLHMRITEVFREKGIEIAYPQMDLHVRTVDAAARDAFGGDAK